MVLQPVVLDVICTVNVGWMHGPGVRVWRAPGATVTWPLICIHVAQHGREHQQQLYGHCPQTSVRAAHEPLPKRMLAGSARHDMSGRDDGSRLAMTANVNARRWSC
jgi:hypothetical protein